jgi:hypothetical protein
MTDFWADHFAELEKMELVPKWEHWRLCLGGREWALHDGAFYKFIAPAVAHALIERHLIDVLLEEGCNLYRCGSRFTVDTGGPGPYTGATLAEPLLAAVKKLKGS